MSAGNPVVRGNAERRRAVKLKKLVDRLRSSAEWVWGSNLAEWLADCTGLADGEEQRSRYEAAGQRTFAGLKAGDFGTRGLVPFLVHQGGVLRLLPEVALQIERENWDGKTRDLAGRPALAADILREYLKSIWLPAGPTHNWLASRRWPIPPWLPDRAAETSGATDGSPEQVIRWMFAHTENRPSLPKRDLTLKECMNDTGCSYREALAAWKALPQGRKRNARQTDRALQKARRSTK
jgi:hypothetical protein